MEINYETFKQTLERENYENAFYILFHMVDNLDPDVLKADKLWTETVRENSSNKDIKEIEKKFKSLPREKKKEILEKFDLI